MRIYLANLLAVALSSAIIWQLYIIAQYGEIIGREPNKLVLLGEMALLCLFAAFAIYNIIRLLIKRK